MAARYAPKISDPVTLAYLETPVGPMLAGATGSGVCLLEFSDRRMLETQLQRIGKSFGPAVPGDNGHIRELRAQVAAYFTGELRDFTLPLETRGTPFQERVWAALRTIPYGQTRSYAELAKQVGNVAAVRAVAKANGDNRISIIVPCHRVIGSGGELTGYGGGLSRKRALLELEGAPGFAVQSLIGAC